MRLELARVDKSVGRVERRHVLGEDVERQRERRAVTLVVLDAREATLSVELQHFVRRVEAERAGAVVAEVAARVHPVSRELLVVLGVALLERRRHGEAVGERVVPLAAHAVEGEQEAGRAVQRLVGVVAQLLRRVVRVGGAARGRDWRALGWGT